MDIFSSIKFASIPLFFVEKNDNFFWCIRQNELNYMPQAYEKIHATICESFTNNEVLQWH